MPACSSTEITEVTDIADLIEGAGTTGVERDAEDPTSSSTRLGCGRDIDDLWNRIDDSPDSHEADCPFCRAARDDLGLLQSVTRELREQEVGDPGLQAGPEVIERILAVARAEVRDGRRLPLDRPRTDVGTGLTVSEQSVVSVIRRVGESTGVIWIRSCRVELTGASLPGADTADSGAEAVDRRPDTGLTGHDHPEPEPADVAVSVRIGAASSTPIPTVVDVLRESIIEVVAREVGITVVRVDVAVEDVVDV